MQITDRALRSCTKAVGSTTKTSVDCFLQCYPDFSRYSRKQGDQLFGQIFIIPLCLLGSNILGIVTTSCARGFYPDEPLLWYGLYLRQEHPLTNTMLRKLYDLLAAIQRHGSSKARAAVFFASFAFFLSQMSVTVSSLFVRIYSVP